MKITKILGITVALLAIIIMVPASALAVGKSSPKTTGGVGYTAYGLQRYAEFNAIEATSACAVEWNVTGSYIFNHEYLGSFYPHDVFLTKTGSSITGNGGYPVGGPYVYPWTINTGTQAGSAISFTATYTSGPAAGVVLHMSGTINPDGTMTGLWDDNYGGGVRNGTWASAGGTATKVLNGCTGKGTFNYSDVNGAWYAVDVRYVNVDEDEAWFAGPVVAGNVGAGQWLFAKTFDGGEPAYLVDKISGSFTSENAAKLGVTMKTNPADGPFAITSGNLQVH